MDGPSGAVSGQFIDLATNEQGLLLLASRCCVSQLMLARYRGTNRGSGILPLLSRRRKKRDEERERWRVSTVAAKNAARWKATARFSPLTAAMRFDILSDKRWYGIPPYVKEEKMRFYGRQAELAELKKIRTLSATHARFTIVTGRRRIGKTELLDHAFNTRGSRYLYFLVSNRAERDLCGILQGETEKVLGQPILGRAERFSQLLETVMLSAQREPLTLVIDEFQEFDNINPAIFGEIQSVWDRLHKQSRINLIVCGSVNRLMNKIFLDDSQPLYGRNTGSLHLDPFPVKLIKEIFSEHCPNYSKRDLLTLWTLTGGIARYIELFMDAGAFTHRDMLRTVFSLSSSYIHEGRAILGEEFGRDHGLYFSILTAISSGATSYAEIRNEVGTEIGGQLTRLERSYSLISQMRPFDARANGKNCSYQLDDDFFRFWFRFVFKYQHLTEQKMFDELIGIVERDFDSFAGFSLERYFRRKFLEERRYTRIGGWWDRRGEQEIDLVCENEISSALDFYEVKINPARFRRQDLERKVGAFFEKNPEKRERCRKLAGLSMEDM